MYPKPHSEAPRPTSSREPKLPYERTTPTTSSSTASKTIALVGHPNSGKTSLFNHLTRSRYQTQNYPGSTVDYAVGKLRGSEIKIIDTPGIVSLSAKTDDEQVTLNILNEKPDLVVAVISATQIERHLRLVKQLQESGLRVLVVATMIDRVSSTSACPVIAISNKTGSGISKLIEHIETSRSTANLEALQKWNVDVQSGFDWDSFVLHPIFGPIIFVAIMSAFFWSIFALAAPFTDAINWGIDSLQGVFNNNPLIAGVGAVIVFVPQILLLFIGMGILDSTGYLARGAVLVDKPLSMIGLNGRSFVPLLSGCACAIPAMMAARTIPNKKERLLTLFIIPLMTCSARLPVYGLLLGLLFVGRPMVAGFALTGIYFGSIVLASVTAAIAGRFIGAKQQKSYFHIELPMWHRPIFKNIFVSAFHQTMAFVKKAGPTILILSLALWFLTPFLSRFGSILTPIVAPLGVDWRVGVALLMAFAAREVFVSALAVMAVTPGTLSVPAIIGLIVFFMIAMQCMSTVAIAKKEMGNWKLPMIMTGTYIVAAYVLASFAVWLLRFNWL